jgi:allantoinase
LTKAGKGKGTEPDGLVLFHAELEKHQHSNGNGNGETKEDPKEYSTFLNSRPAQLELDALELVLKMCKSYPNIRFHIVHLSAAEAVPRIKAAREQGISNLTVETCYHYLTLSSEDIPANATQYKCCPPIRSEANRKQICQALLDGVIDYVVSDHSPCIPELKKGDFMSAWGGVSGLGLGLSLLWTEFGGKVDVGRIMSWVSTIQAQQVGLQGQKGSIAQGMDADLVIFDPEAEYVVDQVCPLSFTRPWLIGRNTCYSKTRSRLMLARPLKVSLKRPISEVSSCGMGRK